MSIYLYWGEDEFAIIQAVTALQKRYLNPDWAGFNYEKVTPDQVDAVIQGLNLAMTPVFGLGHRCVWLVDTTLCQQCSDTLYIELERTLPAIPDTTILVLTSRQKPDGRLKSTKLLQKHADIREFSLIPPWKADLLLQRVMQVAKELSVPLTSESADLLVDAIGNDTRRLFSELEKLRLYAGETAQPITPAVVNTLVPATTQTSLQLAAMLRQRNTAQALALVTDLINHNEPALKIVATLIGQFRTWLWVKTLIESGERNEQAIAQAAEIGNPKRVYFLQQEIKATSLSFLISAMRILLELEVSLKQGAEVITTLQTKVIELCNVETT
jgi:DNA polymerase-3 subunit delta